MCITEDDLWEELYSMCFQLIEELHEWNKNPYSNGWEIGKLQHIAEMRRKIKELEEM